MYALEKVPSEVISTEVSKDDDSKARDRQLENFRSWVLWNLFTSQPSQGATAGSRLTALKLCRQL